MTIDRIYIIDFGGCHERLFPPRNTDVRVGSTAAKRPGTEECGVSADTRYTALARAGWEARNPDIVLDDAYFEEVGRLIGAEVRATATALAAVTPFAGHGQSSPGHFAHVARRAETAVLDGRDPTGELARTAATPPPPDGVPRALYATVVGGVIEL